MPMVRKESMQVFTSYLIGCFSRVSSQSEYFSGSSMKLERKKDRSTKNKIKKLLWFTYK